MHVLDGGQRPCAHEDGLPEGQRCPQDTRRGACCWGGGAREASPGWQVEQGPRELEKRSSEDQHCRILWRTCQNTYCWTPFCQPIVVGTNPPPTGTPNSGSSKDGNFIQGKQLNWDAAGPRDSSTETQHSRAVRSRVRGGSPGEAALSGCRPLLRQGGASWVAGGPSGRAALSS